MEVEEETHVTPDLVCPHCHKKIELLGQSDLTALGLPPSKVQNLRDRGTFPEPYLGFGNRKLYLRSDFENWRKADTHAKVEKVLTDMLGVAENLSEKEKAALRKRLEEKLGS